MQFRGKEMIVWSLNNYLGLVNHPEVRKVDTEAAAKYGMGNPMGARMMTTNSDMAFLMSAATERVKVLRAAEMKLIGAH